MMSPTKYNYARVEATIRSLKNPTIEEENPSEGKREKIVRRSLYCSNNDGRGNGPADVPSMFIIVLFVRTGAFRSAKMAKQKAAEEEGTREVVAEKRKETGKRPPGVASWPK